MGHHEGVGLVLMCPLSSYQAREGVMTTIEGPIARVGRGQGRVLACQVTIEWAMVGHLAMMAPGDGPSAGCGPSPTQS